MKEIVNSKKNLFFRKNRKKNLNFLTVFFSKKSIFIARKGTPRPNSKTKSFIKPLENNTPLIRKRIINGMREKNE